MTTAVAVSADPVTTYAHDVLDGRIIAGRLVRLACERHLRDLDQGYERGLYFDEAAAERAFRFFATLILPEVSRPFILEPWQRFIVGCIYGWQKADHARRFQTLYLEVARGNGKSPLLAAMALYALVADGEQSAQVFSAATTREQARIIFNDVKTIVGLTPKMPARVRILTNNISHPASNSFMRPLSSDASKMDGLRVHMAAVDEIHEHPNGEVIAKLRSGFKGRRQPLIAEATTAGFDRHTVCWEHHEYTVRVLEDVTPNDSWFGYIATIDDGDDWRDPEVWPKANPNIGVSVGRDFLAGQIQEAKDMPGKQNVVRRLHLNEWTEQANRFLDMTRWDAQEPMTPVEDLGGRECFGGLDLASTEDIAAF